MSAVAGTRLVSVVTIGIILLDSAWAHSHLAEPRPTRGLVCRAGNNNPGPRDCYGPCPPMDTYGNPTDVNENNPAATWARGSTQFVKWHKNNHKGKASANGASGFTRLALVPVDEMYSKDAHQKYAFHYACWGAGKERCPRPRDFENCGNDKDGQRYGTSITVPTNYPDGVYVLGYSWYGGGDYKEQSFFGDYYSCSFVTIQGGPKTDSAKAVFVPGEGMKADSCFSAADRTGVCPREPCKGKPMSHMRPYGAGATIGGGAVSIEPKSGGNQELKLELPSAGTAAPPQQEPDDSTESRPSSASEGAGPISGIYIVDAGSGKKIKIVGSYVVVAADYPRGFNIEAEVDGSPGSVEFKWDDVVRTERKRPYFLAGNMGSRVNPWRNYPIARQFDLAVQANFEGNSYTEERQLTVRV